MFTVLFIERFFFYVLFYLFIYLYIFIPIFTLFNFNLMFQPEFFKSIFNDLKSCHYIWFCTLMLHFVLACFLLTKGRATFFFDPKQFLRVCCILWCYFQSNFQPYFKMLVCGAPFSYDL